MASRWTGCSVHSIRNTTRCSRCSKLGKLDADLQTLIVDSPSPEGWADPPEPFAPLTSRVGIVTDT